MAAKLWWIVQKDLLSEYRARRVWPAMLLFGIVVALVFSLQMDLLPDQKERIVGGLLWLAMFFAGTLAIDRTFAVEREEGCWEALQAYPISPSAIFLAKLAVNVAALAALQCVLILLFIVLSDVPLLAHPGAMVLVALLGNLGITSVGTLLSALATGFRLNNTLLVVLALPTVIPVVLASSEATRLIVQNDLGSEFWRWIQLLGAFAVIFITAGIILFDFLIEE